MYKTGLCAKDERFWVVDFHDLGLAYATVMYATATAKDAYRKADHLRRNMKRNNFGVLPRPIVAYNLTTGDYLPFYLT